MAVSIAVPVTWFLCLVGGMMIFSRIHRRRKAAQTADDLTSWWPRHRARDTYITLLNAEPSVPEHLLMAALLARAKEDVRRIWHLREKKQAMQVLIQKGSLSDDTQTKFGAAEKELEAEIIEVSQEANTYRPGWAGWIFASASELAQKELKLKPIVDGIGKTRELEARRLKPSLRAKIVQPQIKSTPASNGTVSGTSTPSKVATGGAVEALIGTPSAPSPSPANAALPSEPSTPLKTSASNSVGATPSSAKSTPSKKKKGKKH